jgi:hypothetical protein
MYCITCRWVRALVHLVRALLNLTGLEVLKVMPNQKPNLMEPLPGLNHQQSAPLQSAMFCENFPHS